MATRAGAYEQYRIQRQNCGNVNVFKVCLNKPGGDASFDRYVKR